MSLYLTTDDLTFYMHRTTSQTEPNLAQLAVDVAEETITGYLEHEVVITEVTERYNGTGNMTLTLKGFPITSIPSLTVLASSLDTDSAAIWAEDIDYTADYDAGIIHAITGYFPIGYNNIIAEYSYGYSEIPNTIYIVGLQIANRVYDFGQAESEGTGAWSATYVKGASNLTGDEMDLLRRWKR